MRFLICASIAAVVAVSVSGQVIRPSGPVKSVTLNPVTGEIRQGGNAERAQSIWGAKQTLGYYIDVTLDHDTAAMLLDWADSRSGIVQSFSMAYCSGSPDTADVQVLFLNSENGRTPESRSTLTGFNLVGLPSHACPTCDFPCWIVTLDLGANPNLPFEMYGPDLDLDDGQAPNFSGVGLTDFGYTYGLLSTYNGPGGGFGPLVTVDDYLNPGQGSGPGEEAAFNIFSGVPGEWNTFVGTYDYGAYDPEDPQTAFGQHWMELMGTVSPPQCPNSSAACVRSDVAPAERDCVVNLADLGVVLAGFAPGVPGKSRADGDIAPLSGDGFVDLSDLGQILSDYGSDCR